MANTHRTPSLWTGRARTPCVSWGRQPSADPAGRQAGELGAWERRQGIQGIQHLFWSACLKQLKTAETTGNNRHRDHRVTIPTGRVFSRTGHDRTNRVPLGEKVGGAMERTELRVEREVAHGFPRFLADPTAIHHGTVTRSRDTLCTNNQPRSSKTSFTGSAAMFSFFIHIISPRKGPFLNT